MTVQPSESNATDCRVAIGGDLADINGSPLWNWRLAVGLVLVALIAAAFAVGFRAALGFVTQTFGATTDIVAAMKGLPTWARVVLPAGGGLIAGVMGWLLQRTRTGQGVGDVMEAIVLGRTRLSMRVTLSKCAGSFAAIASGGSLGREGPLIQFGGAAGNLIGERLGLTSHRTRLLIAAGTAAGFASAYNTPFAAVLFVLEVVTGVVVLDAILPALVATVIAVAVTRAVVGEGPIYGQRAFHLQSPLELAAFAGLGLLTAIGAQGFMRLLSFGERAFQRSTLKLPWRPAVGGLVAGAIVSVLPDVAGNGYEPLNALLDGQLTVWFVVFLLFGKCFATTASVSSGSPGGIFTPTLLVGGALGFLYAQTLSSCGCLLGSPGGYALVGMAAATAATTHAPLMAAVMVFELSGDYAIVLPLILATAIATLVSRSLRRDSVYTAELQQRGIGWEVTMEGRRLIKDTNAVNAKPDLK